MWLVAGSGGRGKTTCIFQVAARLLQNNNDDDDDDDDDTALGPPRVLVVALRDKLEKEVPDHIVEAWEAFQEQERDAAAGRGQDKDKGEDKGGLGEDLGLGSDPSSSDSCWPSGSSKGGETARARKVRSPTVLSRVDLRYVRSAEDLVNTLACFHLAPRDRRPSALLVDDLDLILARHGGGGAAKKGADRAGGRETAFSALEARMAKVSALLKNVADFSAALWDGRGGEEDQTVVRCTKCGGRKVVSFPVVATISKADDQATIPYLDTMKRWFTHIVELGETPKQAKVFAQGAASSPSRSPSAEEGGWTCRCELNTIMSTVLRCPFDPFVVRPVPQV
ncbi:hypothetical protein HOP50_14g71200 [Chloropicon primus]|uniref:Uncharacterized protein n=2 Tax=Chloropicon primus TaxID=1764295 RepID=A0A5B8MYA9_9CHLO|nr:hypothetical protein A3770_14p71000 [Chloropicon primus]UPR03790.1 hypothetical protein HOP50_14g71200 [Chloropicon primus]|eukprot:QDZ24582.1 hypothetical protein A3770_14p71000 [Chloropicon primus]